MKAVAIERTPLRSSISTVLGEMGDRKHNLGNCHLNALALLGKSLGFKDNRRINAGHLLDGEKC